METKLEKRVFYLQIYCAAITLLLGSLFVFGFTNQQKQKFGEIDVERINVVEKDGKLDMVISNKEQQHPGTIDGKMIGRKRDTAGMLFFNDKGDECGGLIFGGDAGKEKFGSLTFDKFRGDQTIQFIHDEDKDGNYFAGLRMNDQNMSLPDYLAKLDEIDKLPITQEAKNEERRKFRQSGEATVNRLFIGMAWNKRSMIQMSDTKGKVRLELAVEANGNPKLNFLDENGKVIYSLPDDAKSKN